MKNYLDSDLFKGSGLNHFEKKIKKPLYKNLETLLFLKYLNSY